MFDFYWRTAPQLFSEKSEDEILSSLVALYDYVTKNPSYTERAYPLQEIRWLSLIKNGKKTAL